jgi:hypothetical protein
MRRSILRPAFVVLSACAALAVWEGCGSDGSAFGPGFGEPVPEGGTFPTGNFDPSTAPPTSVDEAGRPCKNLQCNQVTCIGGGTTTLTGKVYDPAGRNPLYNALVYVPNAPLTPFDDDAGVTCDKCAGTIASGSPIVAAITAPDGTFKLTDVPAGVPLPLVIQVGKWRREVTLPPANPCAENVVTDVGLTRLPRNSSEGHLPHMAITSGGADPFECLLLKIGVDPKEFSRPSGSGRIHYFQSHGGIPLDPDAGIGVDGSTPWGDQLWTNPALLRRYDVVLFPCEGTPDNASKPDAAKQTESGYRNVESYVNVGGRLFTTHYSYTWLRNTPPLFSGVANWELNEEDRSDRTGAAPILAAIVDQTFPKGQAFAQWLSYVGASTDAGFLPIADWRHDVKSENNPPALRWMYADTRTAYSDSQVATDNGAGPVVEHFTFNAPIEAGVDDAGVPEQCGKVVFSDFHVSAGERQPGTFPVECKLLEMTPQEKALEFMLFDLSACIQPDDRPPPLPPTTPK